MKKRRCVSIIITLCLPGSSIIAQEQRRLDNIYTMYRKTDGDMKEMWKRKWYQLVKIIGRRLDENKRFSTDTRKVH